MPFSEPRVRRAQERDLATNKGGTLTIIGRTLVTLAVAAALVGSMFAVFLMAQTTPPAHAGDRKDCSDFRTQKQAQRWFKHHNPRRDPRASMPTMTASLARTTPVPARASGIASTESSPR
jgi:hypothetical protein